MSLRDKRTLDDSGRPGQSFGDLPHTICSVENPLSAVGTEKGFSVQRNPIAFADRIRAQSASDGSNAQALQCCVEPDSPAGGNWGCRRTFRPNVLGRAYWFASPPRPAGPAEVGPDPHDEEPAKLLYRRGRISCSHGASPTVRCTPVGVRAISVSTALVFAGTMWFSLIRSRFT